MKKLIYTVITNKYDTLKEPLVYTDGWGYVCLEDDFPSGQEISVWDDVIIENKEATPVLTQRREKILLSEPFWTHYDVSIYIDGSFAIGCDLDDLLEQAKGFDCVFVSHPQRRCAYTEGNACVTLGKDSEQTISKQLNFYKSRELPFNYGMISSGIMIRWHNKKVRTFCETWWKQLQMFSHRDQVSWPYAIWKHQELSYSILPWDDIKTKFILYPHKKK